MTVETKELKQTAEEGRALYRTGQIGIAEAKEMIMPYLAAVNKKSVELAKKFNVRAKKVNFNGYVR